MEDRGNKRILHTWNTTVELEACPQYGAFFAPKPMTFLGQMLPEVEELKTLCPTCCQKRTARQRIERHGGG